jgi:malyl-CoA/(S)-citramalyl-CoA lyase
MSEPRPARLHRSELAVPATSPRFFEKAAASDADVIFLDLEDAVAPARKEAARAAAIAALNDLDWGRKTMAVRVNGLDTPWAHHDILEVAERAPRLDLILLPKAGSAFEVQFVAQLLTLVERQTGRAKRTGVEVLIETAKGVANVEAIAQASDRLEAMIFGVGDYTVEMRTYDRVMGTPSPRYAVLTHGDDGRERHWNDQWHFAMARIANACRAYGLRPVDGPFTDFRDAEGFRASARRAAALGFEGKWAIHPSQIDAANETFSPTADELAWAVRITALIEETNRAGQGAAGADGVLVDMAHLKMADSIVQRQALIDGAQGKTDAKRITTGRST